MKYGILIFLLVPIILLGIWAAYLLATRKPKGGLSGTGREDITERPELTGREQQKHRPIR